MTNKTSKRGEVTYEIECLPEDMSVRGNAMDSGDAEFDRQVEDEILSKLESGNEWAWCVVRVVARITLPNGTTLEGEDFLGGCSYDSREDFEEGAADYLDDMKGRALDNLREVLARYAVDSRGAAEILQTL